MKVLEMFFTFETQAEAEAVPPKLPLSDPLTRFDIEDAFSRIGRVKDVWVAR